MPNWKDMSAYELDAQPPTYDAIIKTEQKRVKQRVKRTIMPKVRAKVAALGKAKVAEKKLVGKKIISKAKKMEGRIKEKKRVKEGKREIIKGIKKIGAEQLAKKKAAGARIKTKASVAAKMPSIQKKVAKLGKKKAKEKRKVGKAVHKAGEARLWTKDEAGRRNIHPKVDTVMTLKKIRLPFKLAGKGGEFGYRDPLTDVVYDDSVYHHWERARKGSKSVLGTVYDGLFNPRSGRDDLIEQEEEQMPDPEMLGRLVKARTPDPEASTDEDTDDDDEIEVDEITINGKMYYLDESTGKIYDPDTGERVPKILERQYELMGEMSSHEFYSMNR